MKLHFIAALTIVALITSQGMAAGLITTTADLPPDGDYVSPNEYHTYMAMGIVLDDPVHRPRVATAVRTPIGSGELESFDSVFTAVEIGQGLGPITLTGPVQVLTHDRLLSTTGTFATEIVSMNLSGNSPMGLIMIRQDPYRPTLGQTTITDIGGGMYAIDSFFDVFTELSIDGGGSWVASDSYTHMTLVPEPATMTLLGIGIVGLIARRKRRK